LRLRGSNRLRVTVAWTEPAATVLRSTFRVAQPINVTPEYELSFATYLTADWADYAD